MFGWRKKSKPTPSVDHTCDDLQHNIRNAVLGIQLERRNLWKAVDASDRRIRAHIERIEEALKDRKND